MIDTTKVGIAAAKAMEGIENFVNSGDIKEDAKVAAAYIVVALDSPTNEDAEDRHLLRDVQTQCFVFGTPEEVYVQYGVLKMGIENTWRED